MMKKLQKQKKIVLEHKGIKLAYLEINNKKQKVSGKVRIVKMLNNLLRGLGALNEMVTLSMKDNSSIKERI